MFSSKIILISNIIIIIIIIIVRMEASYSSLCIRPRSHLGQNLDKFVLITKKSVKFLSLVDQAKCDLLVSTRTKLCPRRQIFKGAVVLPRSTTFCEQQTKILFHVINLPVISVKLFFPLHILTCQARTKNIQ